MAKINTYKGNFGFGGGGEAGQLPDPPHDPHVPIFTFTCGKSAQTEKKKFTERWCFLMHESGHAKQTSV